MKTIEYLTGPNAALFAPAVWAGIAIALLGGLLSVPVVLRRMAFIGQGVSHAAFGGVGLATVLGLMGGPGGAGAGGGGAALLLIGVFCVGAALGIAWMSEHTGAREDTIIGVFLVGSMALGALLLHLHQRLNKSGAGAAPPVDELLFGSILAVRPVDAVLAWIVAGAIVGILAWNRRELLFWAFDEPAAEAFGVNAGRMRLLLLTVLGVSIVISMKLAGVVLATALLVLPAAAALRLSRRWGVVMGLATVLGLLGVVGGMVLSFEADLPPGPAIVASMIVLFALAEVWARLVARRDLAPSTAPADL